MQQTPQQQYTLDELRAQRAQVAQALALPGVPAAEADIYRETLNTIDTAIREKLAAQQPNPGTAPRNTAPTPPPPAARETTITSVPDAPKPVPAAPPGPESAAHGAGQGPPIRITTDLIRATPQLQIEWADGSTETLNEAAARSRFTSRLRDLEHSTRARQGRFSELPHYTAWWRAAGYYRALCIFWARPPALTDLGITRATRKYKQIFELVANEAEPAKPCGHPQSTQYALEQISDHQWQPLHKCPDCGAREIKKGSPVQRPPNVY